MSFMLLLHIPERVLKLVFPIYTFLLLVYLKLLHLVGMFNLNLLVLFC